MADVPLVVISEFAQSERRITPSWTISQLKGKLETVTGVPPGCQRLSLKPTAGAEAIAIEAANEDDTHLSNFPLAPYAELHVSQSTLLCSLSFVSCYCPVQHILALYSPPIILCPPGVMVPRSRAQPSSASKALLLSWHSRKWRLGAERERRWTLSCCHRGTQRSSSLLLAY